MRLSTKVFTVSGVALGAGTFVLGLSDGVSVANTLGQTIGNMLGFGIVWFAYSRIEFQIDQYMKRRSVQKGNDRK